MDRIGYHCSLTRMQAGTGTMPASNTFQVFLAAPMKWDLPNEEKVRYVAALEKNGVCMVAHGPYGVNMCRKWDRTSVFTEQFIFTYGAYAEKYGVKAPLVMHTQHPEKGKEEGEVRANIIDFVQRGWESNTNISLWPTLLFETDPCARSRATSLFGLEEMIRTILEMEPRLEGKLGICFDTEHSWANGFPMFPMANDKIWELIQVVHLNGIPEQVKCGSGLDRHSKQTLSGSQMSTTLDQVFLMAQEKGKIVILERDDDDVIVQDLQYLKDLWNRGKPKQEKVA